MARFKTTSATPFPAVDPAIVPNATLEQDKATVLGPWKAFRKDEKRLWMGLGGRNGDLNDVWKSYATMV